MTVSADKLRQVKEAARRNKTMPATKKRTISDGGTRYEPTGRKHKHRDYSHGTRSPLEAAPAVREKTWTEAGRELVMESRRRKRNGGGMQYQVHEGCLATTSKPIQFRDVDARMYRTIPKGAPVILHYGPYRRDAHFAGYEEAEVFDIMYNGGVIPGVNIKWLRLVRDDDG